MNKIIRSAYGTQTEYQELSFEAIDQWKAWNAEVQRGNCPPSIKPTEKLFVNCGAITFNKGKDLPAFEKATIKAMASLGHGDTQLVTTDSTQAAKAREMGFETDQFRTQSRGKAVTGVLDTSGGYAVADKACQFALYSARKFGAKFVFGAKSGAFASYVEDNDKVVGVRTTDGKTHAAKLVIVACGSYTPLLVPELDGLCEATAGSVVVFQIPEESPLRKRYSSENFPVWMYRMRDGAEGGLYGFPVDSQGHLKFGYRGTKYTNPQTQSDGIVRSTPVTRFTEGDTITEIPTQAMKTITAFVAEYLPELLEEGHEVAFTRVCWYTDTYDNHFVVDRVPNRPGLMVATGGSGHAFKYLPNIGNWVVDVIEQKDVDRPSIKAWRWRKQGTEKPVNELMLGKQSPRALQNVSITSRLDQRLSKQGTRL